MAITRRFGQIYCQNFEPFSQKNFMFIVSLSSIGPYCESKTFLSVICYATTICSSPAHPSFYDGSTSDESPDDSQTGFSPLHRSDQFPCIRSLKQFHPSLGNVLKLRRHHLLA